jgi:SAM-dependent methyltransferase
MFLNFLRGMTVCVWPAIDYELVDVRERGLLRGQVLNAGCGWRTVDHLVDGVLTNQDIRWPGDNRTHVHIWSPIHQIPRPDNTFDCVLCIAVLEHVENPFEVVAELFRVTKPGGCVVASVPFLQPEHKVPTDFQRYTRDGIEALFTRHGFAASEVKALFSVYHTLHWLTSEWLHMKDTLLFRAARVLFLPPLALMARRSSLVSDKVASAFRIVATKPHE